MKLSYRTKAKILLSLEIIMYIILIFIFIGDNYNLYLLLSINIIIFIILLFMRKTKKFILNTKKSGTNNIIKTLMFNVFMSKKEQKIKKESDWILDINKIKEKYKIK